MTKGNSKPPDESRDLGALLRRTAVDPRHFEDLVSTWNAQFDPERGHEGTASLTAAADNALTVMARNSESDLIGSKITQLINSMPHSAVATCGDGRVIGMNTLAMARLDIAIGDSIDAIAYELDTAEPISRAIRRAARASEEIVLKRALQQVSGRAVTIAIIPARARRSRSTALLFVIDPERDKEAEALVARAYELTPAESEVLGAFLCGDSMRTIAESRGRSLATVRTQFQSAMAKTGASSQSELMRTALALSQFITGVSELAEVAHHPHRRTAKVLRSGGRTVSVVLAGDMSGTPLIFLSTLTHHALPAQIEEKFRRAGLLAVHLWRPGLGGSDPPTPGMTYAETLCDDVAAVLSQLGFRLCLLVGLNSSTRDAVEIGVRMPDRISGIAVIGPTVPRPLQRQKELQAPWAEALYRTTASSPILLGAMVRVGLRAWKLLGTRRFISMQLGSSSADMAAIDQAGAIGEFDRAMIESNAQGVDANLQDAGRAIADWSELVRACRVPIELLHGTEDPVTHISISRAFAAAFSDQVSVTEIEGAGFYSLFSHTNAVISHLSEMTRH